MAKKSEKEQTEAGLEGIEHALTNTERFIEENQKLILNILIGIVAVILIFIGAKRFYIEPREKDATNEMFMAEKFFERDSFALALNGYGTYPGFIQIIDDYGFTKSANLAKYYAGVCYLRLGDYQNAISKLKEFKTDDLLVGSAKYSSLGDAYSENTEYEVAAKYYLEGAEKYQNNFSTPVLLKKAGLAFEEIKKYEKSLEIYTKIRKEYPVTSEGREMDKYIARVKEKISQ